MNKVFLIITLGIYITIAITIILAIAAAFPEIVFFIYFMLSFGFTNDGTWSLLSLDSVGRLKHIASFVQTHLLPWNNLIKIGLIIIVVLAYLALSIFINQRGFTIFKVINNLVGVGFYGVLVYFTSKPSLVELLGMVALLSCVLIPIKMLFYKKISNKISDRVIYD